MQSTTHQKGSVSRRLIGALTLDGLTYAEIDRDKTATPQAGVIVTLVALAGGVAGTNELGWPGFFIGALLGYAGWLLFSGIAYGIAMGLLPGEATEAEARFHGVLRTVGFAQLPDMLVILAIVTGGIVGGLVSLAGSIWVIVCSIVALRVSLRVSTARAMVIGLLAAIVSILFGTVVLLFV
jgi:hypothetical protein